MKEHFSDRDGMNQNEVKSITTQLLSKFENSAPNTIFRDREGSLQNEFPPYGGGTNSFYFPKKCVYVVEWLNADGHSFHRKCFKYYVLSQPWDSLGRPRTVINRRDPPDKVGQTHVCQQAGSLSKESFKLGITGKGDVNP